MARPVIALLTDFGTRDHYAGTMKGVALGICPDITFVDISHEVPPHDVVAGALELAAAYRYFPAGTIFLVVVDPGVGSIRRGIAADTGDYKFVAPDNGVLTAVFDEHAPNVWSNSPNEGMRGRR
jgi:S-adenosylmethionine hydrolase